MAKVTKKDVAHLAQLARIALTEAETSIMTTELEAILGYVELLQKVDTKNVEPTSQVTGLVDVWREDVVKPSPLSRAQLLKNAPQTHEGFIKVKKVL